MAKKVKKEKVVSKSAKTAKKSSLASLFNQADPAEASSMMPPGEHVALLESAELVKKGKQITLKVGYRGSEGDAEGKKITQNYVFKDENGDPGKGFIYFKRDMQLLGLVDDDTEMTSDEELEEFIESIAEKELSVIVQVKQNGQYTNCYLNGLAEDSEAAVEDDDDEADEEDEEEEEEEESEDEDDEDSEEEESDDDEDESDEEDSEEDEDEDEDDDSDDEDEETSFTKKEIMKMDKKQLADVIESEDLEVNAKKIPSLAVLREKVAKALKLK